MFGTNIAHSAPGKEELEAKKGALLKEIADLGIKLQEIREKHERADEIDQILKDLETDLEIGSKTLKEIQQRISDADFTLEEATVLIEEKTQEIDRLSKENDVILNKNKELRANTNGLKEEKFNTDIELAESKTKLFDLNTEVDDKEYVLSDQNKQIEANKVKIEQLDTDFQEKSANYPVQLEKASEELASIKKQIEEERTAFSKQKLDHAKEFEPIKNEIELGKKEIEKNNVLIQKALLDAKKIKEDADQYAKSKREELELYEEDLIIREGELSFAKANLDERVEKANFTKKEVEKIIGRQLNHLTF